ncbi:MAG TPA: hypothetical protein VKM55_03415 [Candidatus Lokiarchaeia archaeon]|nr:hypothetical protein [Candidatus Lokiarchaeia archaeon]
MSQLALMLDMLQISMNQFQYIIIALGIILFIIILVYIGLSSRKEENE